MKCPKCGGAPTDQILMSMPVQYRCSMCDFVGPEGPWMESAKKAHAERLQAARDEVSSIEMGWGVITKLSEAEHGTISLLIDARIDLALLERSS